LGCFDPTPTTASQHNKPSLLKHRWVSANADGPARHAASRSVNHRAIHKSWTLTTIDKWQSSDDCWNHSATSIVTKCCQRQTDYNSQLTCSSYQMFVYNWTDYGCCVKQRFPVVLWELVISITVTL